MLQPEPSVSGPRREDEIRAAVRGTYSLVSESAEGRFPYTVGRAGATHLGYEAAWLDAAPVEVVERFVGVGNPWSVRRPGPGERVLDVGCGCGLDAWVASTFVGSGGSVVGADLVPSMLQHAGESHRTPDAHPARPPRFVAADAECLPFPAGSFDFVVSNGALNLVPDKDRAYAEIWRVLRPGGRFVAADLLVVEEVPEAVLADLGAWST